MVLRELAETLGISWCTTALDPPDEPAGPDGCRCDGDVFPVEDVAVTAECDGVLAVGGAVARDVPARDGARADSLAARGGVLA